MVSISPKQRPNTSCGADISLSHQRCHFNDSERNHGFYHPLCWAIQLGNEEMLDLVQQRSADVFIGLGCTLLSCIGWGTDFLFPQLIQQVDGSAKLDEALFGALFKSRFDDLSKTTISITEDLEIVLGPTVLGLL